MPPKITTSGVIPPIFASSILPSRLPSPLRRQQFARLVDSCAVARLAALHGGSMPRRSSSSYFYTAGCSTARDGGQPEKHGGFIPASAGQRHRGLLTMC
jgi:hypothetical protein